MTRVSLGHNSNEVIDASKLKAQVAKIERQAKEVENARIDLTEIYAEAKALGFNPKVIRRIVRERAKEENKRREEQEEYELYASAIGLEI